jgi:hypothetical protein
MRNAKKYVRVTKQAVLAVSSTLFSPVAYSMMTKCHHPFFSCPWHSIPYFCGAVLSGASAKSSSSVTSLCELVYRS